MVALQTLPPEGANPTVMVPSEADGTNRSWRPLQAPVVCTETFRLDDSHLLLLVLFTADGVTLAVPTAQTTTGGAVVDATAVGDHGPVTPPCTARTRKYSVVLAARPVLA